MYFTPGQINTVIIFIYNFLMKSFLSLQNTNRRSLRNSSTGSQSSTNSRNSQFSLQNVTWEASKTNLYGITELWAKPYPRLVKMKQRYSVTRKCASMLGPLNHRRTISVGTCPNNKCRKRASYRATGIRFTGTLKSSVWNPTTLSVPGSRCSHFLWLGPCNIWVASRYISILERGRTTF